MEAVSPVGKAADQRDDPFSRPGKRPDQSTEAVSSPGKAANQRDGPVSRPGKRPDQSTEAISSPGKAADQRYDVVSWPGNAAGRQTFALATAGKGVLQLAIAADSAVNAATHRCDGVLNLTLQAHGLSFDPAGPSITPDASTDPCEVP